MPWEVRGGKTYRVGADGPETVVTVEAGTIIPNKPDLFVCDECGKEYRTESGMDKHLANKH